MGCRLLMAALFAVAFVMMPAASRAQARTRGIDVSKYQGNINWTKVAKDSTIRFVYIKATEGTSIQDPYYKTNIAKAKKAGLLVGSYHL
jgi:lysozyme